MLQLVAPVVLNFVVRINHEVAQDHDPLLRYSLLIESDAIKILSKHHNVVLFSLTKSNEKFYCRATSLSHKTSKEVEQVTTMPEAMAYLMCLNLPGWENINFDPEPLSKKELKDSSLKNDD